MKNGKARSLYGLLILALIAGTWACAHSPIGKAVQVASAQKQVVEASAVEIAKLHFQGKVPDAVYGQAKDAYGKWAVSETALAKTLADWKRIGDAQSSQRLSIAIQQAATLAKTYLDAIGQFVDLNALRQKLNL